MLVTVHAFPHFMGGRSGSRAGGGATLANMFAGWQEGEKRVNRVVFIGKDLDRQELTEGFKSCLAAAAAPAAAAAALAGQQQ